MRVLTHAELVTRLSGVLGDDGSPRVVSGGNHAAPQTLLALCDAALPAYRLWMLNAPVGIPDREGVEYETCFVGAGMRGSPRLSYTPARLSLAPSLFVSRFPPDVVLVHVAPARAGMLSLGIEVNVLPAAIEAARARGGLVVAQVNPRMPYTSGDALLDPALVDLAIEVDEPLPTVSAATLTDDHRVLGERVAALVPEQATIQIGIGAAPDAAIAALAARRGLRIWSEMISDGVMGLERAGALEREQSICTSFAVGSPEFYGWLDHNPRVRMLRTETTNSPCRISQQPRMTSINTALQVDLHAQANAAWRGERIHSGLGGQPDFVVGALHSPGGRALIALLSWHPRAACSTVVPGLTTPTTSSQHSFVVSEQGVATIFPSSEAEQARQLIERVAHPDCRDELRAAAGGLVGVGATGVWPPR